MIKLDDNLLTELGLQALPPEDKKALLKHIYETLEMRVGTTLARQMTDAQLDEFESFINSNDEAGALHWLETNFPNYKDVVAQEFEQLKAEVRNAAPQILANALAAAQQAQQMPQQAQTPYAQYPQQPQEMYQQPMQQPYAPPQPQQPYTDPQQPHYGAGQQQYYQQPQYPGQPGAQPQHPYDPNQYGQAG